MPQREESLFTRLVRWRASEARTPGEDRLTEVFAAVLERVPGLALHLAGGWLDPTRVAAGEWATEASRPLWNALAELPPDTQPRVATQVPAAGRRVDLELRFASASDSPLDLIVRIEVKHGTGPHSEQIPAYLDSMPPVRASAVVLLAPRDILPVSDPSQVPATVPQRSWQATARAVRAFTVVDDPVALWLCEELSIYLFQEQLMDPAALRPEHLTALAYFEEATAGLAVVCQRASEHLREAIGTPGGEAPKRVRYGVNYKAWWAEPPAWDITRWNDAWFVWGIHEPNLGLDLRSPYVFAGLDVERPGLFAAEWVDDLNRGAGDRLGAEPVTFHPWSGTNRHLHRVGLPQDVLSGATLEGQGESLGRWVLQAYRALRDHGPAPATRDTESL